VRGTGGPQAACGATAADSTTAASRPAVGGYAGDQLANAAAIMNAGAALGLDTVGQTIGVMTAMGESSLRNVTYGDDIHGVTNPDGTPTSSIGLFQQQKWWGTTAQRMDPTQSATLFFQRLVQVPGWRQMTPSAAAHAVQRNADPNHYTKYLDTAQTIVAALIGPDAACAAGISDDAQTLARNLVAGMDAGTIAGSFPNHLEQIRAIADGRTVPNCGVDTRILQVITVAHQTFGKVGISSINRLCTGERPGAGASSWHVRDGGGHAVDFYSLGGTPTTGADPNAIKLLRILDPLMPAGSGTGQSDCRATRGTALVLTNMRQFPDTCHHVHIQVGASG